MNGNEMRAKDRFGGEKTKTYDENIKKVIPGYQTLHELARYLLEDTLPGSAKVLVAGSGTGKEIVDYSTHNLQWRILGFDPSEKMSAIADERVRGHNCSSRVRLVNGMIHDVHETDFDAATSILVMQFLRDDDSTQEFLNEIAARLKPGAPLILVYLEGDKTTNEYALLNSAWKTQQLGTRGDDTSVLQELRQRDKDIRFIPQEKVDVFLKKAGFSKALKFYQAYLFVGQIAFKRDSGSSTRHQ